MIFPIILYDISKKVVSKEHISKTNCFYFYSYKNISVRITNGTGLLYSVVQENNQFNVQEALPLQQLSNNFGYTLYIPNDKTSVTIEVTLETSGNSPVIETYVIDLKLDNIIDETNQHYTDLLINNYLPTFEQLSEAIPIEFNKQELIKRLLLDFKQILKHKGTKKSIETFLEFIGFADINLQIFDEYLNRKSNTVTTKPDKTIDVKTGNYHVLYDNYNQTGLDLNNLPIRLTNISNLASFSTTLLKAIALANVYFTCEEQLITFFGLNYSTNIPVDQSITGNMCMIFEHDVLDFRKDCHIEIKNHVDAVIVETLVKNCLQKTTKVLKSEVKTYLEDIASKTNTNLYFIDQEIYDNSDISEIDLTKIERLFASIIHLDIISPNKYVEFEIHSKSNSSNNLKFDKSFISNSLQKIIVLKETTDYLLLVSITDYFNNTEKYFYTISVDNNIQRIDFETFSSFEVLDSNKDLNNIDLDIDSPIKTSTHKEYSNNFVLPINLIPYDLSNYYGVSSLNALEWLSDNERFNINELDINFTLNQITEKISVGLMENWLNTLCFKYDDNYELKLKVYDANTNSNINIDYSLIGDYHKLSDCLYVMVFDVFDRNELGELNDFKTPYYFITSTETGVDINKKMYDFVLINKSDLTEISIFELPTEKEFVNLKIPVNYDFPLFEIQSEIVPDFNSYITTDCYREIIEGVSYPIVKSIFPRLTKISDSNPDFARNLKYGDIIFCRLNNNYVVNQYDIVWKIFNAFTNELLYESNDYMLKYRIDDTLIYNISCDFLIDGKSYNILKKSAFSSFIKEYR